MTIWQAPLFFLVLNLPNTAYDSELFVYVQIHTHTAWISSSLLWPNAWEHQLTVWHIYFGSKFQWLHPCGELTALLLALVMVAEMSRWRQAAYFTAARKQREAMNQTQGGQRPDIIPRLWTPRLLPLSSPCLLLLITHSDSIHLSSHQRIKPLMMLEPSWSTDLVKVPPLNVGEF